MSGHVETSCVIASLRHCVFSCNRLYVSSRGRPITAAHLLRVTDALSLATDRRPLLQVRYSAPDRALRTLPDGLRVDESSIPGIGLGVFADTFIPK